MKLYIDDIEIEFKEVRLDSHLTECSRLTGFILMDDPSEDIIFSKLELTDDYGTSIFLGKVIEVEQTISDWVSITGLEQAWILKGIDAQLHSYISWDINNIFNGIRDDSGGGVNGTIENDPSSDTEYLYTQNSVGDDDKIAVINGTVDGIHTIERITLNSSADQRSIWDISTGHDKTSTWNEIYSFHLEDDNGEPCDPVTPVYLKDSNGDAIICELKGDPLIRYCAKKDDNDKCANGLLYNTGYTLSLDIDADLENDGKWTATGKSMLDIIKDVCSCSVRLWDDVVSYLADFTLIGNILTIKGADLNVSKVLREDREIIDISRRKSIANIVNSIYGEGEYATFGLNDERSISLYGKFEKEANLKYNLYESKVWSQKDLSDYSMPVCETEIETNVDINLGDRVRVVANHLKLDETLIVQDIKRTIGEKGLVQTKVILSDKYLRRKSIFNPDTYEFLKQMTRGSSFRVPRR